ncbi:MAG: Crp/Fnr family transcriptional regulator [Bacteroidota bacterium]
MNASIAIDHVSSRRVGPFSLNSLFAHYPERTLTKGHTLAKRNHSLGYVFFLVNGMVKSLSHFPDKNKELVNGYHTSGELLNLEIWNNNTSVPQLKVTSAKAVVKVIPIKEFRELVRQNQGLNQLLMRTLLDRMTKQNDRVHRLLLFKSRQRVVQFLIDYVAEVGQRVGYEYVIKKPFTHEEMGNLSDTSRQTVTTVLNELKTKKLIHFTRRYIVIRDLEALSEVVAEEI